MSENEEENLAAYRYYCKSRRDNQHEPVEYLHWKNCLYKGQVKEMLQYGCVIW